MKKNIEDLTLGEIRKYCEKIEPWACELLCILPAALCKVCDNEVKKTLKIEVDLEEEND